MKKIVIDKTQKDQRLDRFLSKFFKNSTRGNIYKMIRKKLFKVNGKRIKEEYMLREGEVLEIYLADETFDELKGSREAIPQTELSLDIVYEDEEILVVNKPKGVLTHPNDECYDETLAIAVKDYLRSYVTHTFSPASISRLDRNTSGLILFGKTYEALQKYNVLMRERRIKKYYHAIVEGNIRKSGLIQGYLYKDQKKNEVHLYQHKVHEQAKKVLTRYKRIEGYGDYSLVEVELITGRSHQIRASLSFIKHPIAGDVKYGGKKVMNINSQLLHCYKLEVGTLEFEKRSQAISEFIRKINKG